MSKKGDSRFFDCYKSAEKHCGGEGNAGSDCYVRFVGRWVEQRSPCFALLILEEGWRVKLSSLSLRLNPL